MLFRRSSLKSDLVVHLSHASLHIVSGDKDNIKVSNYDYLMHELPFSLKVIRSHTKGRVFLLLDESFYKHDLINKPDDLNEVYFLGNQHFQADEDLIIDYIDLIAEPEKIMIFGVSRQFILDIQQYLFDIGFELAFVGIDIVEQKGAFIGDETLGLMLYSDHKYNCKIQAHLNKEFLFSRNLRGFNRLQEPNHQIDDLTFNRLLTEINRTIEFIELKASEHIHVFYVASENEILKKKMEEFASSSEMKFVDLNLALEERYQGSPLTSIAAIALFVNRNDRIHK